MSEDEFGTLYRFVPSVRRGFQPSREFDETSLPESAQPGFGVDITAKGKARKESKQDPNAEWDSKQDSSVDLSLYGPGDVQGLDESQVVRAEPDPGTQQFQPNYFPFVSFDRPDLPWMFSPEQAGSDGRIRPWLTLVTVEKGEGVSIEPSGTNPLPVLKFDGDVDLTAELPPPDETWAWAHAQIHGAPAGESQSDWREWAPEEFAKLSNITVSRLVSPRNLDRGTDYYAAVVPTFQQGRLAGLGEDPYENEDSLSYAWSLDSPPELPFELPVYYHWEFATTDREVTFEKYVENIETVSFGEDVGTKEIDATDPGPESLQPGGGGTGTTETIAFGGALISEPGRDKVGRLSYSFSGELRRLLNKPETLRRSASGPTLPIVGPPLYCQWHAGLEGIPSDPYEVNDEYFDPTWFRQLNQNVRTRGAASRGAKIVRRNQSALMNAAWEVVGEIRAANRAIRDSESAGTIGDKVEGSTEVDRSFTPGEFARHSARTVERLNKMAALDQILGDDGLPDGPDVPGGGSGRRFPDGYTVPPVGGDDPTGTGGVVGGGTVDGGTVDLYGVANNSNAGSGVSGVDPVRLGRGSATEVETTDPMVDVAGTTTPNMVDADDDMRSDGGAGAEGDDGSAGLYAQFLQDLDARPETSRQFQRLVRLDGPLARRSGATEADFEALLGGVTGETLQEVQTLADGMHERTRVRPFAPGSEYWVPSDDIAAGTDDSDEDESDAQDSTTTEGSTDIVGTGFVPMDVQTGAKRSDEVTAAGVGSSGRVAPVPTMTAEREYRRTATNLDDRLPSDERIEADPSEEASPTASGDPEATGGLATAVSQLEAMESHADEVVSATPDEPDATLDEAALRTVGQATSLVADGLEQVQRTVPKALAEESVTLPNETDPEGVRELLDALTEAVDDLTGALPPYSAPAEAVDPATLDTDAIDAGARAVLAEARALRDALGGVTATVPLSMESSAATDGAFGDPMTTTTISLNTAALGTATISGTQSSYFQGRLRRRIGSLFGGDFLKGSDPVTQVMLAPEFPTPMWRPLKELSTEYMLPGIEQVPQDSVGLLTENREFIESYLAGLNHEFARELLWRGFPTDRRGTYFKRFWNKGRGPAWDLGMGVDTDNDSPRDVDPIHDWNETPLGDNDPNRDDSESEDDEEDSPDVVLLLRSRLFKLFPHVNLYAGRAYLNEEGKIVPTTPDDLSVDPADTDDVQFPSYRGKLNDDVTFLGFDLTVDEVESDWSEVGPILNDEDRDPFATLGKDADGDELGYYFVFEERPGEIRFGFDEGSSETATKRPLGIASGEDVSSVIPSWAEPLSGEDVDRTGWEDFSWHNLVGDSGSPDDVSYVSLAESQPEKNDWQFPSLEAIEDELDASTFGAFDSQFDDPPNAHDPAEWGKNAAHMARIAWQKPVRMSRHANLMLEDGGEGDDD